MIHVANCCRGMVKAVGSFVQAAGSFSMGMTVQTAAQASGACLVRSVKMHARLQSEVLSLPSIQTCGCVIVIEHSGQSHDASSQPVVISKVLLLTVYMGATERSKSFTMTRLLL